MKPIRMAIKDSSPTFVNNARLYPKLGHPKGCHKPVTTVKDSQLLAIMSIRKTVG